MTHFIRICIYCDGKKTKNMNRLKSLFCLTAGIISLGLQSCKKDGEPAVKVEKIEVAQTSVTLNVGETYTPEVIVTPENAKEYTLALTSDNETVAKAEGLSVKALAAGTAVITVNETTSGASTTFAVTVFPEGYPKEAIKMTTATGFFYGDYYMAGTDNAWALMTSGNAVFSGNAFEGEGIGVFMELNAPKTGEQDLIKGTYVPDPDGKMEEFTFTKGEDFNAEGLQGTFIYDSSVEGNYLMVKDGWIQITSASGAYEVTACLKTDTKSYTLTYSGSFPLQNFSKDYDNYKVVEMNKLAVGTLDYYGQKIYGSTATAPHSEWTIYLGVEGFDFETYEGSGDMLMLDIITAEEYTREVPSGRYTVMYAADNAHFQPFMTVPGLGDASTGNTLGTWYAPDYMPMYGANIGYADIVNKGNDSYSIEFKFRDDRNEAYFQGKFDGKLVYGDYHE